MGEEPQSFSGAIIILFFLALIIVGGGIFGYLYYTGSVSLPFGGATSSADTSTGQDDTSSGEEYDPSIAEGDINDDGKVDFLDSQYISDHGGCSSGDDCWQDVIGNTITGHNPIYTSDLDLNLDGMVDDTDAAVITNYGQ